LQAWNKRHGFDRSKMAPFYGTLLCRLQGNLQLHDDTLTIWVG
jgi:hypothetical protein